MKGIHVDAGARTVRVEAGCTWGDVDHATHAFGLATPSGVVSTTGVGGLTLGGGIGHLSRRFGLTIDNLLSADLVLADGSVVTASADEHPDLFWAIRGGGGNFGVVTSFVFRLHPVSTVYAGPTLWPIERAGEVLRWFRDFILEAARGPRRLLRLHQRAARPAVPRGAVGRHRRGDRVVLHRAARRRGGALRAHPRGRRRADRRPRRARPVPRAPGLLRSAAAGRHPVLLARGLRRTPHRRGHRAPRRARVEPADAPVDRPHLSPRRRRPARRPRRHGVQLPGRRLRRGHRRLRHGSGQRRAHPRLDGRVLGRRPPVRGARARTSTS